MLQTLLTITILSMAVSSANAAEGSSDWDYWTDKGPGNWSKTWPVCGNGERQSPINIQSMAAEYDENLGDIMLSNYDSSPSGVNFTAKNNGLGFTVTFEGYNTTNTPKISGGGLPGTYQLANYHFHWGRNNTVGSEHQVDGESYPAELHLVHMNTHYPNISVALPKPDGLAVLGVFLKVGKKNMAYEYFLNLTKFNVTYPDTTAKVTPFALMSLLPTQKTFYRYNGSLTTPGCQESVTWTVFNTIVEISADQLNEFRNLKYKDENNEALSLVDTFRPPQPLHGRTVYTNFEASPTSPTPSTTPDHESTTPDHESTTPDHESTTPDHESTTPDHESTTPDQGSSVSGNLVMLLASLLMVMITFSEN